MKQHPGNVGSNYHFLFLKQYLAQIKNHESQLKSFIRQFVPLQIVLEMQKYPLQNQKGILNDLFHKLQLEPWAKKIIDLMSQKLLQKSKQLYQFQTQRNYYLVQNFRQTINPPITKGKPQQCYNLSSLFKININKQLRRVIWTKCLMIETNKFQFFKFDHKVNPYNLIQQLSIGLIRLSQQNKMRIKENQKDCCIRLLQYIVKKWDKIPTKSEQYLALTVVDVYAHFTPTRIHQIGSVYVGLVQLAQTYFQQNVNQRLQYLRLAFQLVDPDTFKLIQECYLPYSQKNNAQLNQCFEHFRLTLTSAFFPPAGSQFIVDQLLIKKRNKLDMYIIFALMTMIMSDDLQKYKEAKMKLTDVINAQNTKRVIKTEDVVDAFRVVYENIHPFHLKETKQPGGVSQVNKLLQKLLQFDEQTQKINQFVQEQKNSAPTSLKVIEPQDKLAGFVVEDKTNLLRLGNKIDKK